MWSALRRRRNRTLTPRRGPRPCRATSSTNQGQSWAAPWLSLRRRRGRSFEARKRGRKNTSRGRRGGDAHPLEADGDGQAAGRVAPVRLHPLRLVQEAAHAQLADDRRPVGVRAPLAAHELSQVAPQPRGRPLEALPVEEELGVAVDAGLRAVDEAVEEARPAPLRTDQHPAVHLLPRGVVGALGGDVAGQRPPVAVVMRARAAAPARDAAQQRATQQAPRGGPRRNHRPGDDDDGAPKQKVLEGHRAASRRGRL